jgi:hypothetical protein
MGLAELDYQNHDLSFLRYRKWLQEHGRAQEKISVSAWTVVARYAIIYLPNVFGDPSNVRRSIPVTTRRSLRPVMALLNTCFSAMWSDFMSSWGIKPLMRYMLKNE